jgi:uncharacterized protein
MPVKPTHPGVYIEELSSGVRTVTGVSTSVAAFVGQFPRGLRDEAVQIFNMGDFETEFGGLHRDSVASYGIQQLFQNGGTEAWVVRVVQGGSVSTTMLRDQPQVAGTAVLEARAGRRIRGEAAENPGIWGNDLYLEVDYDTADTAATFNLTVSEIQTQGGRRVTVRSETFRNLTLTENLANSATEVVGEGSRLVQLTRQGAGPLNRPAATGTLGTSLPIAPVIPANGAAFTVDPGTGAINCTLAYGTATAPGDYAQLRPYLEAAIREAANSLAVAALAEPTRSSVRALLSGATVRLEGRGTVAAPFRYHVLAGRGSSGFLHTSLLTFAGAIAPALGLNVAPNWQLYKLAGGTDSAAIGGTNLLGNRATKSGMYALEDVDLFNILCIPQAADLDADNMRAVYAQAETYCEERRAFLLIDIPEPVATLDGMQTWLSQNESLRHRNAAVYFPRALIPDPLSDNRPRSLGSSGTIAGLYARTDAARGVWKAPAGTDARLRNVQALAYLLTDPQNGALNPLGVNCLRTFPVYSHVCWGARTLDGADAQASEWKYIPVRRFTLFLEESLYRATKWAVFEPNDEPLWAQLRLNIGAFMHNLFRQGAFQGTSPRDAYLVKCDRETTTQNDIDQGIVNILVAFAPLKPAEFVIIKIQQKAGQIQT